MGNFGLRVNKPDVSGIRFGAKESNKVDLTLSHTLHELWSVCV
jgi:hypothetical protein